MPFLQGIHFHKVHSTSLTFHKFFTSLEVKKLFTSFSLFHEFFTFSRVFHENFIGFRASSVWWLMVVYNYAISENLEHSKEKAIWECSILPVSLYLISMQSLVGILQILQFRGLFRGQKSKFLSPKMIF